MTIHKNIVANWDNTGDRAEDVVFYRDVRELERENARLLSYIRACRFRFGDAAVNSAIMEMCPPESARKPMTEERARQLFEAVRRLHSPDSALANPMMSHEAGTKPPSKTTP